MSQWLYRKVVRGDAPPFYSVGYYTPDGTWVPDQDFKRCEDARQLIHYLSGGNESSFWPETADMLAQTDREMLRLGWTAEAGRAVLKVRYSTTSRRLLSPRQLLDFLLFLGKQ